MLESWVKFVVWLQTAGQLFFVCEHVSETGHVFIARVQETSKFIIQSWYKKVS